MMSEIAMVRMLERALGYWKQGLRHTAAMLVKFAKRFFSFGRLATLMRMVGFNLDETLVLVRA